MTGYLPLRFIEEKIRDLEYALFFSMNNSVLKIPACVVKVLETDEVGQLWFIIPRPSQFIHTFDKTFPVKLDFFRKGRYYFLKILGKAFLVNDPEEINIIECLNENIKEQARTNNTLIVKVKITHAEYLDKTPVKPSAKSMIRLVRNKVYNWFRQSHPVNELGYQQVPGEVRYASLSSHKN